MAPRLAPLQWQNRGDRLLHGRAHRVPLQLHYGLADEHIPKSESDAVATAAFGNANIEIQLYPGAGHGFFNRTCSPEDVKAVETATAHIDRFLGPFK